MNMLNNSVIICDPLPKEIGRKTPKGNKKRAKAVQRTYYESPLKHIKQSSKRCELLRSQAKVACSDNQLRHTNNFFVPKTDCCLSDSVIVLSDNDCEVSEVVETRCCRRSRRSNTNGFSKNNLGETNLADFLPLRALPRRKKKQIGSPKQSEAGKNKLRNRKRKRRFAASLEDNVFCLLLSDSDDSDIHDIAIDVNEENIAPLSGSTNQGSDDVVVVWSSTNANELGKDESESQSTTQQEAGLSEEPSRRLFTIDYTPSKKNLKCLKEDNPMQKECKAVKKKRKTRWDVLPFSTPGLQLSKPDKKVTYSNIVENSNTEDNKSTDSTEITEQNPSVTSSTVSTVSSNPVQQIPKSGTLREVIIDGNNVAMAHTNGKSFSEHGLKLAIDYFKQRGHVVKAFVPQHRRSLQHKLLEKWYLEGTVVFTPSRTIGGKRITPYDDRFILEYATLCGGVVVSMDQYRDLYLEKPQWRDTIANRLLIPTFVGDYIMFPEDPLGRNGPTLEKFLRH